MDDERIRAVLTRLSRRNSSGGLVVERAAVIAEGGDSAAIFSWIADHDGQPEARAPAKSSRGLHRGQLDGNGDVGSRPPQRYVLPPGVLT
jgi:hypothetical protein